MDKKVDILRKEKKDTKKEMKKLAKRINSVSMSRDSAPMTARNFKAPSLKKFSHKIENGKFYFNS